MGRKGISLYKQLVIWVFTDFVPLIGLLKMALQFQQIVAADYDPLPDDFYSEKVEKTIRRYTQFVSIHYKYLCG